MTFPILSNLEFPWRCVGRWETPPPTIGGDPIFPTRLSSGALIGSRYVITAGHVYASGLSVISWFAPGAYDQNGDLQTPFGISAPASQPSSSSPPDDVFLSFDPNIKETEDIAVLPVNGNLDISLNDVPGLVTFLSINDAKTHEFTAAGYGHDGAGNHQLYCAKVQ
jgi:hypothetical protein